MAVVMPVCTTNRCGVTTCAPGSMSFRAATSTVPTAWCPGRAGWSRVAPWKPSCRNASPWPRADYKEVTLLGQNIDAYGRDMQPKRTFAELLTFLNANLPDKFRIRYVSVVFFD